MTYHLAEIQLLPLFSVHFLLTFYEKLTYDVGDGKEQFSLMKVTCL